MTERSVLIVGDDADAREMLRITLENDGYHVATAGSSRSALETLRSNNIDCILLDMNSGGAEASRFHTAQQRDRALAWIPLVVLSSRPDASELAQQLGAKGWLRKPFDLGELDRVVRLALAGVSRSHSVR